MAACYICKAPLPDDLKGIGWLCAKCAADYERRRAVEAS